MKLSMIKKIFTGIFTGNSSAEQKLQKLQKLQEAYDFLEMLHNDLEEGRSEEEYIEQMILETLEDIKILESA